jgi:signal transduction histidine kinase
MVSFLVFGSLHVITVLFIQPSFSNLETRETKEGIVQAINAIDYRVSELSGKVRDYSSWDETYNFVQNENQDYVENNFIDETFENLDLNIIAIVNNNRSLVYCQSFDLNYSAKVQTSEETKNLLPFDERLWGFPSEGNTVSGIMLVDNQPMFVATAPILTSLSQGPIIGGLLFGRFVDSQEIGELAKIMNLNFSVYTISNFRIQGLDSHIVDSLLSKEQTVVVKENSPDAVSGYTLIRDIHSNSQFILQTTRDRAAYQQGVWVRDIFLVASLVLSICVGAGFQILLEREIVKPMTKLATYVKEMPHNPTALEPKALVHSSEELGILTNAIRDAVKKKLEGMNEVSRMVAHDLRNPLAGINGASYMLKKNYGEKMDEKGNRLLEVIGDCVEYSDKIVRDLLEYSCEIKLNKTKANPEGLVTDSLSTLVVPGNVLVINEVSDEFSLWVDNGKLQRVFSNLIKNALDSMADGGILKITSRKVNGEVEIGFSDTGTGMSDDTLKRLWTPFFTTKAKGMGVGLSICKRIIDAHGGRIEAKSTIGKGTVFTVFLPIENS